MVINPTNQNGLNYSPNVAADVFEKNEQYDELCQEYHHWRAVQEATREYRWQNIDFFDKTLEAKWIKLAINIKAWEEMGACGLDVQRKIEELKFEADQLLDEDEHRLNEHDWLQEMQQDWEAEQVALMEGC